MNICVFLSISVHVNNLVGKKRIEDHYCIVVITVRYVFEFLSFVGISLSSLFSQQYLEILAYILWLFFHGQNCVFLLSEAECEHLFFLTLCDSSNFGSYFLPVISTKIRNLTGFGGLSSIAIWD